MALTKPCVRCGRPGTTRGKCDNCRRIDDARREQERGTAAERGYDAEYFRRRAALAKLRRSCCLCGTPIDYSLKAPHPGAFSAHHLTQDKRGPIDAAHLGCNESAGKPQQ